MKRSNIIIISIWCLWMVYLFFYTSQRHTFYVFADTNFELTVRDNKQAIIYQENIIRTDLFVPGFFEAKGNFPIQLSLVDESKQDSFSFEIERSLFRYSLVYITKENNAYRYELTYRFLQPIFQ